MLELLTEALNEEIRLWSVNSEASVKDFWARVEGPGWVAQLVEVWSCTPKDGGFNSFLVRAHA